MPYRRSGRRALLSARRRGRYAVKRYRSLYDPTPYKLTACFRAWFPGDYTGTNTTALNLGLPIQFFLNTQKEETVNNMVLSANYSSVITGANIAARIISDNNITKSLLAVYNLFCLKGVAVRASVARPCDPSHMPYSQNCALCLYWGKTAAQLPAPAAGTNQSLYEVMVDQDRCFTFQVSCLANRPASRYYRAEYDSMGLGGKTYNSVELFTNMPFAVQITSQNALFTINQVQYTPILEISFDFYVTFKDKNG